MDVGWVLVVIYLSIDGYFVYLGIYREKWWSGYGNGYGGYFGEWKEEIFVRIVFWV